MRRSGSYRAYGSAVLSLGPDVGAKGFRAPAALPSDGLDSPPTLSTVGSLYRPASFQPLAKEAVAVFTGIVPATGQGRSRRIPTSSDLDVLNTTFIAVNPRRASVPSGRLSYQALKETQLLAGWVTNWSRLVSHARFLLSGPVPTTLAISAREAGLSSQGRH